MKKNILKVIAVFLIFYYGRYLQLIPIYLFNLRKHMNIKTSLSLSIFSNTIICLIFIFMFRKDLKKEFKKFKENLPNNIDCALKYWIVGYLAMLISNLIIIIIFKGKGATNEKMIQTMIDSIPYVMLFNAAILGPFIEEITFRKTFKLIIKDKYRYILTSGIIFGALHVITSFQTPKELLYIIPYSSLGIAFAAMYEKTDTIYTSLFAHMLHNFIFTLLSI